MIIFRHIGVRFLLIKLIIDELHGNLLYILPTLIDRKN
jgi:hypothetical protein